MSEMVGKLGGAFGLIALFFVSLLFFIIASFPYGILKEYISAVADKEANLRFRAEELSPSFPLGIHLGGVSFDGTTEADKLEFESIDASVSLLSLFIGKIGVDLELESKDGGTLDGGGAIGIGQLLSNNPMPSSIGLKAEKFPIGPAVGFLLGYVADGNAGSNPLVKELLQNIVFRGDLVGDVDFNIDVADPVQSSGAANLNIQSARFGMIDPNLNVPEQKFETAKIEAELKDGVLNIKNTSRFKSQGLNFGAEGKISLKDNVAQSLMDLKVFLKLDKELKQNYGFLLGSEGEGNWQVRGMLGRPDFVSK